MEYLKKLFKRQNVVQVAPNQKEIQMAGLKKRLEQNDPILMDNMEKVLDKFEVRKPYETGVCWREERQEAVVVVKPKNQNRTIFNIMDSGILNGEIYTVTPVANVADFYLAEVVIRGGNNIEIVGRIVMPIEKITS